MHRLSGIDAQIRQKRYPNCVNIADKFSISSRQAARDVEYLRDSMGAPIEFCRQSAVEGDNPNLFALSYNSQCWAECRKHAAAFLQEAAERIGGTLAMLLTEAANLYQEIYLHLQAAADLLPFEGKSADHYQQPERFVQIAVHVRQAKLAESAALSQLSRIVAAL